jgi:hypothetical protein
MTARMCAAASFSRRGSLSRISQKSKSSQWSYTIRYETRSRIVPVSGEVDAEGRAGLEAKYTGEPALEGVGVGEMQLAGLPSTGGERLDVSGEADTDVAGTEIGMQKEFGEQNKSEDLLVVRGGGGKEGRWSHHGEGTVCVELVENVCTLSREWVGTL